MLPRSAVNGPGERAVVWFQGCDLQCRGCFNPASHPFNRHRDKPGEDVAELILACRGIEGVTFSGGAPFQQAGDLRQSATASRPPRSIQPDALPSNNNFPQMVPRQEELY
jgi:anaerobic ribonucleoside-triphosphate reductase activating protein